MSDTPIESVGASRETRDREWAAQRYLALTKRFTALQADNERLKEEGIELFDDAVDARKEVERLIDLHRKAVAEAVILSLEKDDRDEEIERLREALRYIADRCTHTPGEKIGFCGSCRAKEALASAARTSGEHGEVPTRNSGVA